MPRRSAEELDVARQQILNGALGASGAGLLLEAGEAPGLPFRPVAISAGVNEASRGLKIGSSSLLPRWLRVNDAVLEFSKQPDILAALPSPEQQALQRAGVTTCVPLVYGRALEAWLAFCSHSAHRSRPAAADNAMARAHAWALALHEAKSAWRTDAQSESVSRSNRLTVAGQLAASIAHEVRNPLAAIRSTVQLIRDEDAPPQDHDRLLTTVIEEVDRVNDVLSRMLALGRERSSTYESCDLAAIANAATDFCFAYAKRQGQRLARRESGQLHVVGDHNELRQVLVNVLLNACQASQRGAAVSVETLGEGEGQSPRWAVVRVTDGGSGIRAEDLPHVFEPFFSTKRDGGGLGLSICRDIIQRHGGHVDLVSEEGTGTTVTIRLPLG
jgi:signal transduction histidine kinase